MIKTLNKAAHFDYIEAMRAIAVLSVVLYHLRSAWLPGGFAGVDIFFVISGFIVSASVGSLDKTALYHFIPFFYARRLQRIGPALIVCLLVTSFATALLIPTSWLSGANQQTGLYAFFGLSNLILAKASNDYFSPIAAFNPYTQTWSLGVEEQFYFVFPFLFFAWTFAGKWRRVTVCLFAAAFVASFTYSVWISHTDKTAAFYMITSRFWQLAAGGLLFQIMTLCGRRFDINDQPSPKWFTVGAFVSLLLLGYGFVASKPDAFPYPGSVPSVLGALGLIGFLHGKTRENPLVRVLTIPPLLFIGRISYSLYLWHWPVFALFRWTVGLSTPFYQLAAFLLAFVLSVASYYFVETPIRRLPALRRMPRYAVVVIGLAFVGSSAWIAAQVNAAQPKISITAVARDAADWYPYGADTDQAYPGCVVNTAAAQVGTGFSLTFARSNCVRPVAGPRVFAIGDSHALAYEGMYKGYAMEAGASVVVYNNGGCPFLSLQPQRENSENCQLAEKAALADILAEIRPGDIIFLPSLRLPRFSDQWVRFPDNKTEAMVLGPTAVARRKAAAISGEKILREFSRRGARVVFEAPTPLFKSPTFRCVEAYNRSNPICADGPDIDRGELNKLRKPVLNTLEQMAQAVPGVSIWDPFPILCPPGPECHAIIDGKPLFFDGDHLSGYSNRLLLPSFHAFVAG